MAWHRKKPDPISNRARALNGQIAELEAQIKRLDAQLQRSASSHQSPRIRSTTTPHGATINHRPGASNGSGSPPERSPACDPIFEEVDQVRLKGSGEPLNTAQHYNELGVRKYDLLALLRRIRNHFRAPTTTNPKLVSYLAAGGIQGLRPLRYEKRVARNRFIFLFILFFLMLLGLAWAFVHHSR
jgi:hypothetical protein